ncbi:unnamed protein product [Ceutorhynchus assimilis]|uniref:Ankyrin repeat protein n=1 Tax=Ceutorhynchus assimilis TaxID=467358 RepID=A0A9N9MLH6_9CUCU|nr:unnamed protein product [Ceutorhynchus assimilis]
MSTLRQQSDQYQQYLDDFQTKFEQNVQDFLQSTTLKCLVMETSDTKATIWNLLPQVSEFFLLQWADFEFLVNSNNLLPKLPQLTIIEIHSLQNDNYNIMDKLFYRLNLSKRKMMFITSQNELLDDFLRKGTFLKIDEFHNKTYSLINHKEIADINLASMRGLETKVLTLLENNHHPDKALIHAATQGYYTIVLTLIEYNAEVNIYNNQGQTPLHLASKNGHYCVVYALLKHRADVNSKDNNQFAPLHYAAIFGHADIVRLLLNMDACIDPRTADGDSPIDFAKEYGHQEVVQLLQDCLHEREILRQTIKIINRKSMKVI